MTTPISQDSLLAALDAIEDEESQYLAWSLVDEDWDRQSLLKVIARACPDENPEEILDALRGAGLVGEVPQSWPPRYRSRMAETVRLLAHLRQQFPGRAWRSAPPLVADYRFRHEARRFPKRNIPPDVATARLSARPSLRPSLVAVARRVIGQRQLSEFQLRSAEEVFDAVAAGADRGVVVGAGTGSGKTLAFSLPALSLLSDRPPDSNATGVIAIYPRNELLKDQLATALNEVERLRIAGGREIRIGAYFGPTPTSSRYDPDVRSGWRKLQSGWVCPYLTCRSLLPTGDTCGGSLVWLDGDRRAKREVLACTTCSKKTHEDQFALTRQSMQERPPDLLFTTTEMLNRSLSDGWSMHVFGVGPRAKSRPQLVLLDEVHTYTGSAGAQAAYLLRRWRHALASPIAFIGLSATLANAEQFFADLSGVHADFVREVTPHPDDLVQKGREYQILLRGDPASQTALLSTSIQSLMLMRRMLDRGPGSPSFGTYGNRVFAFCDNLDLVNRLYRQLLDAEGRTPFNKPDPNGAMLAGLRLASVAAGQGIHVDWKRRDPDGQYWWYPECLGFGAQSLSIGRTSSQDGGVEEGADVVVATASLEVGFDDPEVGAVLQHKAPRDVAQFLQRRGRAGRSQSQRPWTVVVLSDFGRDRSTYQDYEGIFDPLVPPRTLPLGNQSVRKMQAAMCLLDWAATQIDAAGAFRVSCRALFARPVDDKLANKAVELVRLLQNVLDGGPERRSLMSYIQRALRLSEDEATSVLWSQPRPLLLEVIPTSIRRISSRWSLAQEGGGTQESYIADAPLPEFIPRTLFDDLLLPEVQIVAPDKYNEAANTSMPVLQALGELAPGRVTLRWAVRNIVGLWTPVSGETVRLEDQLAAEGEVLGVVSGPGGGQIPLVRPLVMKPVKADADVQPTSNGRLDWMFDSQPVAQPLELVRPRRSPILELVPEVRAYLHAGTGPLRVRRYALTAQTMVRRRRSSERSRPSFTWKGSPAALGYETLVDAIEFVVHLPEFDMAELSRDQRRLRQLRRDLMQDSLATLWPDLEIDTFLGDRIFETVLTVAAGVVAAGGAVTSLQNRSTDWWQERVAAAVASLLLLDEDADSERPLQEAVSAAFGRPEVLKVIDSVLPTLGESPTASWRNWLEGRFLQTLAAALQLAAQNLCTEFDLDSEISVDIAQNGNEAVITISDLTVGGGGVVEALARRVGDDPRRFDQLVVSALEPTDLEETDNSLTLVLGSLPADKELGEISERFRKASREDRLSDWRDLLRRAVEIGADAGHGTASSLLNRVFRPGSSTSSDELLQFLVALWDELESKAGFAFGQLIAASVLSDMPGVVDQLSRAVAVAGGDEPKWASSVLRGLLWPRAEERRGTSLQVANRFVTRPPKPERTLVLDVLDLGETLVDVDNLDWRDRMRVVLDSDGRATLYSGSGDSVRLNACLVDMVVAPVELGWLFSFAEVVRVRRSAGGTQITVAVEEATQ